MSKTNKKHLKLSTQKKFLGVAGGIAEYYATDPNLLRVLVAIFIVLTGIIPGLIVYLIVFAIIKSESK